MNNCATIHFAAKPRTTKINSSSPWLSQPSWKWINVKLNEHSFGGKLMILDILDPKNSFVANSMIIALLECNAFSEHLLWFTEKNRQSNSTPYKLGILEFS